MHTKQQSLLSQNENLFTDGYTGFINISAGNIYKSSNKQNNILYDNNYPETVAYKSEFYTDRIYSATLTLPHQLDDILLQPNELVTATVLNKTFEKLFNNVEYILSRCIIYTNSIPTTYNGWFGCGLYLDDPYSNGMPGVKWVDDEGKTTTTTYTISNVTYHVENEYTFHTPDKPAYQYMPCKYAGVSGIMFDSDLIDARFNTNIHEDIRGGTYITSPNTSTINTTVTTFSDYNNTYAYSISAYNNEHTSYFDTLFKIISFSTKNEKKYSLLITENSITFAQIINEQLVVDTEISPITSVNNVPLMHIVDVDIGNDGMLYIADSYNDSIYQFDLNYIINEDNIIKKPILKNIIGGKDNLNNQIVKFNNIGFIKYSNGFLFVYDNSEFIISVYDRFLNFKRNITNIGFSTHTPVGVIYRELQNEFVVLTKDAKLYTFDNNFNIALITQLVDIDDICTGIANSTCDSNIYYISTVSEIIQKLFSNNETVGKFAFTNLSITNTNDRWWRSTNIPWSKCSDLWGGSYNFPTFTDTFIVKNITVYNSNKQDEIWIFANNGRLIWLSNDVSQINLFSNYPQPLPYNKTDLVCDEREYVQSFTYNRLIRKFVDILLWMINNVEYSPTYNINSNGDATFAHLKHITHNININSVLKNIKIYDNDLLTTDIINRVITHLFDIEQQVLNNITAVNNNTRFSKTNTFTIEI